MEFYKRDFLISRISCGYLKYREKDLLLKIYYPTQDIFYEANEIYYYTYKEALEEGVMDEVDVYDFLLSIGKWTEKNEEELEILPKHIEHFKEQIYDYALRSTEQGKVRKYLKVAKDEYKRLTRIRHSFDHYTCEGLANYSKWQFIIEQSTYQDEILYDWENVSSFNLLNYFNEQTLSDEIIRALSRKEPWSSIWAAGKKNGNGIFKKTAGELTDDQRRLILWSSLYDNIQEASEPPPDYIIEDDDALDGWLIKKRKEREGQNNKTLVNSKLRNKKIAGSSEIFIQADTEKDADIINQMNDIHIRNIKRQRMNLIHQKGSVLEHEFADVKQRRAMEAAQHLSRKVKETKRT